MEIEYYVSYQVVTPHGNEFNYWLMNGNINCISDIDFIVDEIIEARYNHQCKVTILSWQRIGHDNGN